MNNLISGTIPLEGHKNSALEIRKILGFGSVRSRITSADDYSSIIDATIKLLRTREEKTRHENERVFVRLAIDMLRAGMLITSAELGYYVRQHDRAYTYLGFFLHRKHADTIINYAHDFDDVDVFVCDSESELKMWRDENSTGEFKPALEKRKYFQIAACVDPRTNDEPYYNAMLLRYPHGDLEPLNRDVVSHITAEYIWVQVRAMIVGERVHTVSSFIRGLLAVVS